MALPEHRLADTTDVAAGSLPAGEQPRGRDLGTAGEFAQDDGSVPTAVAEVLRRRRAGLAGVRDVVPVLAEHRLLIPLLEVGSDVLAGDDADPCAGQDRAVAAVSMRTEEGVVGLAFTGLSALASWDRLARPMPVPATRVAAAILAEGGVALVVDPGSPEAIRLRGPGLLRLARGGPWPLPWQDPEVQRAVVAELGPALAAGELAVRLGDPGSSAGGAGPTAAGLLVELRMDARLGEEQRRARAGTVARRLGQSQALRDVFDGTLAVVLA